MRMAELSARSGVSVPTIKFYKHEGLLPPGLSTSPNQVEYGIDHLHRLRLVRVLTDLCGLSVAEVRQVLLSTAEPRRGVTTALAVIDDLPTKRRTPAREQQWRTTRIRISAVLEKQGWRIRPNATALDKIADTVAGLQASGREVSLEVLADYARLADATVAAESRLFPIRPSVPPVEALITLTAVYEGLFLALRRLAREHRVLRSALGE